MFSEIKIDMGSFGSHVFDQKTREERLPTEVYEHWQKVIEGKAVFDLAYLDIIAQKLKKWALESGATHYTHWFQPLNFAAAQKHDAFLGWNKEGGVIQSFSGKELMQAEPDASSFPSGGLRATHEARGYTMWDPTTPPFLWSGAEGMTLYLPSLFFSWKGDALDYKIPLLRSEQKIREAGLRLLRFCNIEASCVFSTLGAEQEYFIIDRDLFLLRPDLILTGRTVVGAEPAKGQELEDHYFSSIQPRVLSFMRDVEKKALRLAIPVKTRHNEVAPLQHEVAPLFEKASLAIDHNLLLMEIMRETALEHNLVCLFHEKPFAGINGSGKHNNWSLASDTGINLLDPKGNRLVFFTLLAAILRAVHLHAPLLRASIASAGNDLRLGGSEAPPAIASIDLGEALEKMIHDLAHMKEGKKKEIDLGLFHIPLHGSDLSDRNRTSFFAFTGNKFEFRAVGASMSCSWPMTVLNAIVAESLNFLLDQLEKESPKESDLEAKWQKAVPILQKTFQSAEAIVFSGNGYSFEWAKEAQKRNLPLSSDSHHAYQALLESRTLQVFEGILTQKELHARYDIMVEQYAKIIRIEAKTLIELFRTQILPACLEAQKRWARSLKALSDVNIAIPPRQADGILILSEHIQGAIAAVDEVYRVLQQTEDLGWDAKAKVLAELITVKMGHARSAIDKLEMLVDASLWPLPKYRELLFIR